VLQSHKTKTALSYLRNWDFPSNVLFIHSDAELDPNFALGFRNIGTVKILSDRAANVYEIVKSHTVVLTVKAVRNISERLLRPPHSASKIRFIAPTLKSFPPVNTVNMQFLRTLQNNIKTKSNTNTNSTSLSL